MRIARNALKLSRRAGHRLLVKQGHPLDGVDGLDLDQHLAAKMMKGEVFLVEGQQMTRNMVVEYVCRRIVDGEDAAGRSIDLVDLCREPGMPKLSQFQAWRRLNPMWDEAVLDAERTAALLLVHEARGIARQAEGAPQAAGSKLAVEALQWEAARLNQRFAEKQVLQVETTYTAMSDDAIITQLVAAMKADPAVLQLLAPQLRELAPELAILSEASRGLDTIPGEVLG